MHACVCVYALRQGNSPFLRQNIVVITSPADRCGHVQVCKHVFFQPVYFELTEFQ